MNPNRKLKKPDMRQNRRLKLKKPDTASKLILEEIIGLTVKNANGLASSILNSTCVYLAGCVVVAYNVDSGTQSHLMVSNRSPKPLSCIAVSKDGKFIAAGESGHQPAVLVWDSARLASVCELKGHQYGVTCIAFSPDGKHLVSVGFPNDGYLCLWDFRSGILVTKLKACSSFAAVASVSFSLDAKSIITAGRKHLKLWTVGSSSTRSCSRTGGGSMGVQGRPVSFGHHKGCSFVSMTSPIMASSSLAADCNQDGGFAPFYALTDSGVLCLLNGGLTIMNSVDLKVEKAFAVSASTEFVACACQKGVVVLFMNDSLEYAGGLLCNEVKGRSMVKDMDSHAEVSKDSSLPDAIACQFSTSKRLVVVYRDHSLYIWNIHDKYKATKSCVIVSHSTCLWDIKNLSCENMHDPSLACVARGCPGGASFATCSADGTIRLWDVALQPVSSENLATDHQSVITEPVGTACLVRAGIFERESVASGIITQGYRAMAVSSDGKYLAAGDCDGNLHIYDLLTSAYTCIQDAHEAEILSLSFSSPVKIDTFPSKVLEGYYLLASGGKDRMIHVYDVERNFNLVASAEDHAAAVTSVKLTGNGRKLISCSADRSLAFRDISGRGTEYSISRCHHQMASHGTIYDITVDQMTEVAITVGQDKKINTFKIAAGQLIRSFKQERDSGDPMKVTMDPSCSYVVCSYSNRSICMYDFMTGELVSRAVGHGDVITGFIFLPDCEHLISVDGDGCIFVWRVPAPLSSKMLQKIKNKSCPLSSSSMGQPVALSRTKIYEGDDNLCTSKLKDLPVPENSKQQRLPCQEKCPQEASTFKFSISRLPLWAQSKVTSSPVVFPMKFEFSSCQKVGAQAPSPLLGIDGKCGPVRPTLQTPSKHYSNTGKNCPKSMSTSSSEVGNCKGSPTPQEARRSFALDKRWLTIHTVCLDLLKSPEVCSMDLRGPTSSAQNHAMETSDAESRRLSFTVPSVDSPLVEPISLGNNGDRQDGILNGPSDLNNFGSSLIFPGQLGTINSSACHAEVSEASSQLLSDNSVNEDNKNSNLNIDNLSSNFKAEGRTSSTRKRYSGQFFVRRDLHRGQKFLLDLPIKELGGETTIRGEGSIRRISSESPVMLEQKVLRNESMSLQHMKNTTGNTLKLNGSFSTSLSLDKEVVEVEGREDSISEGMEKQKIMIACKEALLTLDATIDNALQVFSELGILASGEEMKGPEAQFYAEAAEMLSSMLNKVQEIAKMANSNKSSLGGENGADVLSFEPLLGTFAENLSHRVIEILSKNISNV